MMMALKHAKKKPKITKEVDELDVSKSSDGGAMALLRNVTLLIKRAEVILEQAQMQESGEDGSSGGEDSSKEADMASWSKQLRLVANGVSVLTRRRQPGSPVTDLPSADERVALTELLRNVETVIEEHETGNLSAESMAKLEFSINSLAIIDIEEGMDSTKVPDWVPEESIDQRKLRFISPVAVTHISQVSPVSVSETHDSRHYPRPSLSVAKPLNAASTSQTR
jgi:hypothetical protein